MSDTNTTTVKPKADKPKAAPTTTRAPRIEHSALIAQYAKAKGIDTTRAGKLLRARLRSNFDTIAKGDPKHYGAKGAFKQRANDKRPWGSHSRKVMKDLGLVK